MHLAETQVVLGLYDLSGKKVLEVSPSGNQVDLSELESGTYVLTIHKINSGITHGFDSMKVVKK